MPADLLPQVNLVIIYVHRVIACELASMVIYNEWSDHLRHWTPTSVHPLNLSRYDMVWPNPLQLETQQDVTILVPDYKV